MSAAAWLRDNAGKQVIRCTLYKGPTETQTLEGVTWTNVHGHVTRRGGVLEVRSRDLIFWDNRFARVLGNGLHLDKRGLRVEGDKLMTFVGELEEAWLEAT